MPEKESVKEKVKPIKKSIKLLKIIDIPERNKIIATVEHGRDKKNITCTYRDKKWTTEDSEGKEIILPEELTKKINETSDVHAVFYTRRKELESKATRRTRLAAVAGVALIGSGAFGSLLVFQKNGLNDQISTLQEKLALDTDGDGVPDISDNCRVIAGNVSGCPDNTTLKAMYDIGVAAAKYNFSIDSDWANLRTPQILYNFLNETFSNETFEAAIDPKNLSWEQGMAYIALFSGNSAGSENATAYLSWLQGKAIAKEIDVTGLDREQIIAALAAAENVSAQNYANASYLQWLRVEAARDFPAFDWANLTERQAILDKYYDLTYGAGKGDLTDLLKALDLTQEDLARADSMDGTADGKYTIENLIEVFSGTMYGIGYAAGLQDLRTHMWMGNITAPQLYNLSGEERTSTLGLWEHNADIYPEKYAYLGLDSGTNTSQLLSFYNDGSISNATKAYVRGWLNSGATVKLYNLANVKGDEAGKEGAYVQAFYKGKVADKGLKISDAEYRTAADILT